MAKTILRDQARELRISRGLSIKEISEIVKVSKSSIGNWCRDIMLSDKQLRHLENKQRREGIRGSIRHAEKLRVERIKLELFHKKIGKEDIGYVSDRDLLIMGISLYWAEGYKNGNNEVGFTNSDPRMIRLMLNWFRKIYNSGDEDFIFRLSINHLHKNREKKVLDFWTKYLNIPISQFTKTSFIKSVSKKVYKNHDNYFGVLRVKVRRGVNLRNRILGSIEFLAKK